MKTNQKKTFLKVKPGIGITLLSLMAMALCTRADITVFAAASTTDVMKELAEAYEKSGGERVRFNFASSGALARLLDAGAPADLFVSANTKWMDYVQQHNLIVNESRTVLLRNSLVLVAPEGSTLTFEGFPGNLKGRLAIGEPKSVPAGAYAQQALESLNKLDGVREKLIKGKDVRTVLLYVARHEVEAGIVYATDARCSKQVKVLGTFPTDSHPPIIYPVACLKDSSDQAQAFLEFLQSETAKAIFAKHGFSTTD